MSTIAPAVSIRIFEMRRGTAGSKSDEAINKEPLSLRCSLRCPALSGGNGPAVDKSWCLSFEDPLAAKGWKRAN